MDIRYADRKDLSSLHARDKHLTKEELGYAISRSRVILAEEKGVLCGWLRFNLFWDNTPFMNMLYVLEEHRGKGFGRALTAFWEQEMKNHGYSTVMTSTQSDEYAQHFYQKLGYAVIGGFLPGEDPYEVILSKIL